MSYEEAKKRIDAGEPIILACYGVDIDAVAGWLGSYDGEDSPDDISRGVWAGQVGQHRLLDLFKRYNIKATWFSPGHSIETFPEETKRAVAEGHELGLHGYSHENPIALTSEQEEKILLRCIALCEKYTGKKPVGYRAPWWEFSKVTNDLLLKHGVMYDSSLMHRDYECYYIRTGDSWDKIDYGKDPDTWMKPMRFGQETDLLEIPASWYLDDLPPMMFIKKAANSFGWVSPRVVQDIWRAQFDWLYREVFVHRTFPSLAVFPLTIHPDVSGRAQNVMLLQEPLIEYMLRSGGVYFLTYEEVARLFTNKYPRTK